ncbi:MAG: GNAT family N-acetyltransferase [Woeseiaceae bacterium]
MTRWRRLTRPGDAAAVERLVAATGFFSDEERRVAVELVEERLAKGEASGYEFVFADAAAGGSLLGYACYGPIPATQSSCDLYWIAVSPAEQGKGLGRELADEAERLAREQGMTRMYADTSGREQYASTRAFYESLGYSKAAVLEDFYAPGDAKVIYSKALLRPTVPADAGQRRGRHPLRGILWRK